MITPKELKRLAKACREAGVKAFKCPEFEFSLTDSLPEPKRRLKRTVHPSEVDKTKNLDDRPITDEELLLWSAQGIN